MADVGQLSPPWPRIRTPPRWGEESGGPIGGLGEKQSSLLRARDQWWLHPPEQDPEARAGTPPPRALTRSTAAC